jgi:hypothetical protein
MPVLSVVLASAATLYPVHYTLHLVLCQPPHFTLCCVIDYSAIIFLVLHCIVLHCVVLCCVVVCCVVVWCGVSCVGGC